MFCFAVIRYKKVFEEVFKEKIYELEKENNLKIDLEILKKLEVGVVILGV